MYAIQLPLSYSQIMSNAHPQVGRNLMIHLWYQFPLLQGKGTQAEPEGKGFTLV